MIQFTTRNDLEQWLDGVLGSEQRDGDAETIASALLARDDCPYFGRCDWSEFLAQFETKDYVALADRGDN